MSHLRRLTFLSGDELRDLLKRREAILAEEERAAVQAALDEAETELRARLKKLLGARR
jgi:flagellar motility protein MotE (MotC chaperone)